MPEQPIVKAMAHILQRRKGAPFKENDTPNFHLEIFPMIFALGSDGKKSKPPLTIDREQYSGPSLFEEEPELPPEYPYTTPSEHSIYRSRGQDWEYLLNSSKPGPFISESRGKLLIIAAGNHALLINFSLEGHVIGIPTDLYHEIISKDVPGPNVSRGDTLRTFELPNHLLVPGSFETSNRTVNIYAAYVSNQWVWAVVDFSRLLRLHVISRDQFWAVPDFQISSPTWPTFFTRFRGGPDWASEQERAAEHLDIWRMKVKRSFDRWEMKYHAWEEKKSQISMVQRQRAIFSKSGFRLPGMKNSVKKTALKKQKIGPAPPKPNSPIIQAIMTNNSEAFSGYGRYTANDLLYELAIFPSTPSHIICRDDFRYNEFKSHLHTYMTRFSTGEYLNRIATIPNQANPFSFNERSNHFFLSLYIDIFRRRIVRVPKDLYTKYASNGYFDRHHTIGEPYAPEKAAKAPVCEKKFKMVSVNIHKVGSMRRKFFSIFEAQSPSEFVQEHHRSRVTKDISEEGYKSTIGPAQFHEQLMNRVLKADPVRGRPKKINTGKRGRPARSRPTIRDVNHRMRQGRKIYVNEDNITSDDETQDYDQSIIAIL